MIPTPKTTFISLNEEWTNHMAEQVKAYVAEGFPDTDFSVIYGDIQSINFENTAFVSPANSLGFMDGGVDAVLSRKMFPGIQKYVQESIRSVGLTTALGRCYLPVGSALIVKTNKPAYLIVAPTMFLPHDVSATRNAYYSVFAALNMWAKHIGAVCEPIDHLVFTSHCCGYGRMSPEESAKQTMDAYRDFAKGLEAEEVMLQGDPSTLILKSRDDEQPTNYDNREIKTISVTDLIK